jgi:hypothetical protein
MSLLYWLLGKRGRKSLVKAKREESGGGGGGGNSLLYGLTWD